MTCKAIRQGDQMQCAPCGLAWDVDDQDRPGCRPAAGAQARQRRNERQIKTIRGRHGLGSRNHG